MNCLVKQFAMYLGVFAILLLNVMDVFSVCGVPVFPSERLCGPSIYFVCVVVCRKLSPHLGV